MKYLQLGFACLAFIAAVFALREAYKVDKLLKKRQEKKDD